ncbi:putative tail fiber protein [Aeromonas phage 4L372XY]|uniref:Putative tail fiber protein n=1 Tax=Aeromonas phage 4L372XY TaxID=2588520 RepID=A0A5B9N8D0_9CAUD|nr:tail fiber protein [Aeromonas phage 4L372XY]QEG08792.1 putative tail fiber protein [Aeromonas phage 4L372XY]
MTTYREAVEQTITAGEQIHQIVNGTATTEVTVEDGSKVPSVRKALLDNFYFKDPLDWQAGQQELVFNQLRKFTDGSWWYAPSATTSNPVSMGVSPVGDLLWRIYDFDAIGKLEPRIDEALRRSYSEAGYTLVQGSFEQGGTITNNKDVLLYNANGEAYTWSGGYPKIVSPGTNPSLAGSSYISRAPETLRKVSFDLFGATDSPFTPSSERLKIVCGGGVEYPGKLFVLTQGGGGNGVLIRLFNGNIAAPSLPSNSENGSWALWRTGVVSAIEYAWVYKKPSVVTGSWTESNVTYSAVDIYSEPMLGSYKPLKRMSSSVSGSGVGAGNELQFNVNVGIDGAIRVGFMGTATAPLNQQIKIDGVVVATVSLRTPTSSIVYHDIKAAPGPRVVTITHTELSTNLNVIGVNFLSINDLKHWNVDVDSWAAYTRSPGYVTNEGAAEYAIRAKNGANNWAGSYHGGEYERASPEFSVDHRLITPSDSLVAIGRRFSILQQTQLRWASTLESLDMDSLTIFCDGSVFMQCAISNANLIAHTAYLGMNTTSPAYDSAIGSKYYDNATTDGESYVFGPCQQVTQIERATGRLVYTRFSRPPLLDNSFGGPTVSFAAGAYAKLYSGFIRNASTKLPTDFSFAFQRAYL